MLLTINVALWWFNGYHTYSHMAGLDNLKQVSRVQLIVAVTASDTVRDLGVNLDAFCL